MSLMRKKPLPVRLRLRLTDHDGTVLFEGYADEAPLDETVILEKSIEFFADPHPCFIHKGAVMTRMYGELTGYLESCPTREPIPAPHLPPHLLRYLGNPAAIASITIV